MLFFSFLFFLLIPQFSWFYNMAPTKGEKESYFPSDADGAFGPS